MKKRIKINGFIIFFSVMLIAVFPRNFLRLSSGTLDSFFCLLGMALLLSGMLLRVSARGYKSEHSAKGKQLVSGGPYALVRNPMYLGILFIGTGVILACFKWWVLFVFLSILAGRYLALVFKEEKMLLSSFGKDYADYRCKIPRLLPKMGVLLKGEIYRYLPLRIKWLKKEANSIIPVIIAMLALRVWAWLETGDNVTFVPQVSGMLAMIAFFAYLMTAISKKNEKIAA